MRYVVIMAGGSGTRFWPSSRRRHPKQFLAIGQARSLLRQTADRVAPAVSPERIWVVTGAVHADHATGELPDVPPENILVEPAGRNTAPCIGWATRTILARDPEARIAVLPADHYIGDEDGFRAYLDAAFEAAEDRIVLFGIVPTRPETGYGYIQRAEEVATARSRPVHGVLRFVEKPDVKTAAQYLASGDYLWNSGMFVFPARLMDDEIARHLPGLHAGLKRVVDDPGSLSAVYPELESVSIDYGVMERSESTAVIPASFAWSDVGSWEAAKAVYPDDEDGNVILGDAQLVGVTGALVDARAGRFVAVVGLDDVVVVDTEDALLVARTDRSQDVKKIVEALKSAGRDDLL